MRVIVREVSWCILGKLLCQERELTFTKLSNVMRVCSRLARPTHVQGPLVPQTSRTAPLILSHVTAQLPRRISMTAVGSSSGRPAQGQPQRRRRVGPAGEKTAKTPELCPKPANFPSKPTRRRQASRPSHDLAIPSTTSPHGPIGLLSPAPTPIDSRHPVLSPRATCDRRIPTTPSLVKMSATSGVNVSATVTVTTAPNLSSPGPRRE